MDAPSFVADVARLSVHIAVAVGAAAVLLAALRVSAPSVRAHVLSWAPLAGVLLPIAFAVLGTSPASVAPQAPLAAAAAGAASTVVGAPAVAALKAASWAPLVASILLAGAIVRACWLANGYRRLRRGPVLPVTAEMADDVRVHADAAGLAGEPVVEWRTSLDGAATLGLVTARVLFPASLAAARPDVRRAVMLHEFLHVRAGHHRAVLREELLRCVFWFHPLVHWAAAEACLAREQTVDRGVVERTRARKTYLDLLFEASGQACPAAGLATRFFGRHQLERRIRHLRAEGHMKAWHKILATIVLVPGFFAAQAVAMTTLPLQGAAAPAGDAHAQGPGPREQEAIREGNGVPGPQLMRVVDAPFSFPDEARNALASAIVTVRLALDHAGQVEEARTIDVSAKWLDGASEAERAAARAVLTEHTLDVVKRWGYQAPPRAPWVMTVVVSFDQQSKTRVAVETYEPRPRAARTAARPAGSPSSAVRAGGAIPVPKRLSWVPPVYPEVAKDAGVSGVVTLGLTIAEDGSVADARVLRSIPLLDQAAVDSARQWRYEPLMVNGRPVPVTLTAAINFTLDSGSGR